MSDERSESRAAAPTVAGERSMPAPPEDRQTPEDVEADERRSRMLWWFVAPLLMIGLPLLLGLVGYEVANSQTPEFSSQAIVVATSTKIPSGDFADVSLAVFQTDDVLNGVIHDLNLQETPSQLLHRHELSADAVANTSAVRITAQSTDRSIAQQMADSAANSLITALEGKGLATLKSFPASRPGAPQSPPRLLYAFIGLAGGFVIAVVVLWTIWLLRRRSQLSSVIDGGLATPAP